MRAVLILLIFLIGCSKTDYSDLDNLYSTIQNDLIFCNEGIDGNYHLAPDRYEDSYNRYVEISYHIRNITEQVDRLINSSYKIFKKENENLVSQVNILIDSVLSVNDNYSFSGVFGTYNNGVMDTLVTEKEYLCHLTDDIFIRLNNSSRLLYIENLKWIKVDLALIEKDILYTVNRYVSSKSFDVNFFNPISIQKNNKVEIYVTAIDTLANNFIVIGDFIEKTSENGYKYFKEIRVYDTININKTKAVIPKDIYNKGQVILNLTMTDGFIMQKELN